MFLKIVFFTFTAPLIIFEYYSAATIVEYIVIYCNAMLSQKKKVYTKKIKSENANAGMAIEKMLVERKISSKINYDVLRGSLSLNLFPFTPGFQWIS